MSKISNIKSGAILPPSLKRRDAKRWLQYSSMLGAVVGFAALWLVWRDFPWLPQPVGSLGEHAVLGAKLATHSLFPFLFSEPSRFYSKYWQGLVPQSRFEIEWRLFVAGMSACVPCVLLAKPYLTSKDHLLHLRGATRHAGRSAVNELRKRFALAAKASPDHEIAPGVVYPADMWTRHVLVVGGVGAGKSTFIKPLIEKIEDAGEQMLLFDPKGEFTMGFKRPAIIAPWDARSLAWDIASDMRNVLSMRYFAASMIQDSSDPMWANASRQVLVGLMVYLKGTRGNDWNWRDLADLIFLPQSALSVIMRDWHPEALRALEKASVTTQGVLINLASFCAPILDLANAWGDTPREKRVSFIDWAKGASPHRQIIIQGHGSYPDLTKRYLEGIVGTVAALLNSVEIEDDAKRKLWFIADEFGQMGKIPVRALFEVGRSRGVRCVIACQDFAQLEEIHGSQMIRALLSMSGTLVVGQMSPGETAERLCKAFGNREIERANESVSSGEGGKASRTWSFNREDIALYKPSELTSRLGPTPDRKGVKLLIFTRGEAYEIFYPHHHMIRTRRAHVPAAWILPTAQGRASDRDSEMRVISALHSDSASELPRHDGATHSDVATANTTEASSSHPTFDYSAKLAELFGERSANQPAALLAETADGSLQTPNTSGNEDEPSAGTDPGASPCAR